jgi:chromosome segregation protein
MNSNARITRLVAQGFKSFAKKTEMEFSDGFNIILGPNGSGKSNVLDAICFVLGKSGAKGLRAEKTANLIYNGGKRKQPATKAEVSIFFDNEKKLFPVDSKELKITRTLSKEGTSQYRINDKKHTRQQVVDLLANARINPDGYNVILQGDIISFVEQSGSDRRQLIEQIAGIDIYEDKKQKTLNFRISSFCSFICSIYFLILFSIESFLSSKDIFSFIIPSCFLLSNVAR